MDLSGALNPPLCNKKGSLWENGEWAFEKYTSYFYVRGVVRGGMKWRKKN